MRLWCWWITFSGIRSLNQQALYQHTWLGTGMSQPTQTMEHAVTSPTTSPLHKMAWLSLRDKDAHCGMERLHFQISIPAAICWPLSSKERLYTSGAEIAMVVAKDRNTKNTNTWHLNWDVVAVQYFVACHHANLTSCIQWEWRGTQQRQLFWEILKLSKPYLILAATARSEVGSLNNEWRSVVALASLSPEEKMQCATDSCWGEDVCTRWWCFCIRFHSHV